MVSFQWKKTKKKKKKKKMGNERLHYVDSVSTCNKALTILDDLEDKHDIQSKVIKELVKLMVESYKSRILIRERPLVTRQSRQFTSAPDECMEKAYEFIAARLGK